MGASVGRRGGVGQAQDARVEGAARVAVPRGRAEDGGRDGAGGARSLARNGDDEAGRLRAGLEWQDGLAQVRDAAAAARVDGGGAARGAVRPATDDDEAP